MRAALHARCVRSGQGRFQDVLSTWAASVRLPQLPRSAGAPAGSGWPGGPAGGWVGLGVGAGLGVGVGAGLGLGQATSVPSSATASATLHAPTPAAHPPATATITARSPPAAQGPPAGPPAAMAPSMVQQKRAGVLPSATTTVASTMAAAPAASSQSGSGTAGGYGHANAAGTGFMPARSALPPSLSNPAWLGGAGGADDSSDDDYDTPAPLPGWTDVLGKWSSQVQVRREGGGAAGTPGQGQGGTICKPCDARGLQPMGTL